MRRIFKHRIKRQEINSAHKTINIHRGAKFLTVAEQDEDVSVWFQIDDVETTNEYNIITVGTGIVMEHLGIPEDAEYLGTALTNDGNLVHHVYGWWNI